MTPLEQQPPETALVPCPLCGADKGYTLDEGSTYRWWSVCCANCGREVDEARATYPAETTPRTARADAAWNDAGAHAQSLREALSSFRSRKDGGEETCPDCHGSGEGVGMEGRGPDTYEVPILCPKCKGTGAVANTEEADDRLSMMPSGNVLLQCRECASYDPDSVCRLCRVFVPAGSEQQGAPVATVTRFHDLGGEFDWVSPPSYRPGVGKPLYASKPQQEPGLLTEAEFWKTPKAQAELSMKARYSIRLKIISDICAVDDPEGIRWGSNDDYWCEICDAVLALRKRADAAGTTSKKEGA